MRPYILRTLQGFRAAAGWEERVGLAMLVPAKVHYYMSKAEAGENIDSRSGPADAVQKLFRL